MPRSDKPRRSAKSRHTKSRHSRRSGNPQRPASPPRLIRPLIEPFLAETGGDAASRALAWRRFRLAAGLFLLAPVAVGLSQAVPHIYWFFELGLLYPFTVYDLALAVVGLGCVGAQLESAKQFFWLIGVFMVVLAGILSVFVPLWNVFLDHGLQNHVYLGAPLGAVTSGIALWMPPRVRFGFALFAAVVLACALSLFVGLSEFAHNINTFTLGALVTAFWLIGAPAFLLRRFKRPWLTIAGRILGSWLVAIALMLFVFAVMPMPAPGSP